MFFLVKICLPKKFLFLFIVSIILKQTLVQKKRKLSGFYAEFDLHYDLYYKDYTQ